LQRAGYKTVSISSFAQRHSAFHWYAGFDEAHNVGKFGLETADEVFAITHDWLTRNGQNDNWFLHVHLWDPHTPYRAAEHYGEPFQDDACPAWLTEEVRASHWLGCGPHSARECMGFAPNTQLNEVFPRQPQEIDSMAAVRKMFDGYDTGVLVADTYAGRILELLDNLQIADDTVVVISSDHGETLGELNIYGDHQTADEQTSHIPMIVKWPGMTPGERSAFHYHIDVFATLLALAGGTPSKIWDAQAFDFNVDAGRDHLVVSQGAWTCQRSVRWDRWLLMRTYHDGYHLFPELMLFDLEADPHEQHDLTATQGEAVATGIDLLDAWHRDMLPDAARGRDPLMNVINEGGPFHVRGQLQSYLARLRATDREACARDLEDRYAA
jgi:arylsulfatase A-like enzyme